MNTKTIYLAGGCFWGLQKFFDQFDGVVSTEVGYANGSDAEPSYEEVCADSGHVETVRIDYDDARISLTELLDRYFMVIDPTSVNRQGNDRGIQYRTGIYYTDAGQLPEIEEELFHSIREIGCRDRHVCVRRCYHDRKAGHRCKQSVYASGAGAVHAGELEQRGIQ